MPFNVQLPVCPYKEWTNRYVGFRQWLDAFTHWPNLTDARFPAEILETLQYPRKLMKAHTDQKLFERSFRVLSYLKQSLSGFPKGRISSCATTKQKRWEKVTVTRRYVDWA